MEKYKILFVCLGNICRSPAGEGIMKKLIDLEKLRNKIEVDSAGTSGWHSGDLPDLRMRQHGAKRGYHFDSCSRKFTQNDFYDFDIILAMDDTNYYDILSLSPNLESNNKVYRMTDFLQKLKHDHIPDPYYSGAAGFELVLDLLEDACEGLLAEVKRNLLK